MQFKILTHSVKHCILGSIKDTMAHWGIQDRVSVIRRMTVCQKGVS